MWQKIKHELNKYRHVWPLLYFCLYVPWFFLLEYCDNEHIRTITYIHCPLDDLIPFNEWFIIPYFLWFLYTPAVFVFLFFHSKNEFYRICAFQFTGMTVALIIFTVFPTGLHLRPDVLPRDNILTDLVQNLLYHADTPTNVLPSIHVFGTIATHICLVKSPHMSAFTVRRHLKVFSGVLVVLIVLSTMFLKQHSVYDVLAGIALTVVMYIVTFKIFFRNWEFPGPVGYDPDEHQVLFFLNKKKK